MCCIIMFMLTHVTYTLKIITSFSQDTFITYVLLAVLVHKLSFEFKVIMYFMSISASMLSELYMF